MAIVACGLFILATGGCAASSKLKAIEGEILFEQEVLKSSQPVVVEFAKGGCPTCALVEPVLEKLQEEYEGRVTFGRYMLMTPFFGVTSAKLRDEYRVAYYPTVILFVGGQEKKRWVLDYTREHYVKVLTDVAGEPAPKETLKKGAVDKGGASVTTTDAPKGKS
jgi:thioredoxin 1